MSAAADIARGAELARTGTHAPEPADDAPPVEEDLLPAPSEESITPSSEDLVPLPPEPPPGDPGPPDDGPLPESGEPGAPRPLFPSPAAPLDVAKRIYTEYKDRRGRRLLCWRGSWWKWRTTDWSEMDVAELRSAIYDTLGRVDYHHPIVQSGVVVDFDIRPWNPDKRKVANVIEAMAAVGHLSADVDPPSWIGVHSAAGRPAAQMISCANGILDLTSRTLIEHTPALFNAVSVPFDYNPHAPTPTAWLKFLEALWPGDPESVALLQEFLGYVISGRTDMQKMMLLIGPTRSGKGTIARMVTDLVGRLHVAGPTLASLGTNFGLSPLLGKPLAIISDARLGDAPSHTVVERLLSISGEDMVTVDRKFRDPWSGKLPTRFVVLSNELPRFKDSSGAIANRLVILQMTESFLGREDRTLDDRLRAELPGILLWALDGLDRLARNGRFTVPASSGDAAALMMDLASPVSAFVRERCQTGAGMSAAVDELYAAWKRWAEDNGHAAGAKSTFGRNLRSVVPSLKLSQPMIGGTRVRTYSGIRVCNAELPVHPVHDDDHAADTDACTGCAHAADTANPLVNGLCTGCTGKNALQRPHQKSDTPARDASRAHCPVCGYPPPPGFSMHHDCANKADATNQGALL